MKLYEHSNREVSTDKWHGQLTMASARSSRDEACVKSAPTRTASICLFVLDFFGMMAVYLLGMSEMIGVRSGRCDDEIGW